MCGPEFCNLVCSAVPSQIPRVTQVSSHKAPTLESWALCTPDQSLPPLLPTPHTTPPPRSLGWRSRRPSECPGNLTSPGSAAEMANPPVSVSKHKEKEQVEGQGWNQTEIREAGRAA